MIRNFYQKSLENTKIRKKLAEKSKYSVNTDFSEKVQHSLFLHWDSLHARLNSHYEVWSYKKKKHKKI